MWDWAAWQTVGQTAWDWGSKMGLGGVIGWFLQRWFGARDRAVDRGRALVADARPDVVPTTDSVFMGDHRARIHLRNDGPGAARDIRVTFTGSGAEAGVPEIGAGQSHDAPEMKLSDSPFFHQKLSEPAKLTVTFKDRFQNEYKVELSVQQERRNDGEFNPLPEWGQRHVTGPRLTKRRLREIGSS